MTHTNRSFVGESFDYDANGNRNTTGYTTSTGNETSSDGTYNYAYDNDGNLISKTSIATGNQTLYSWDYRNRLVEVDSKVGSTTTPLAVYTYDAFNNPIKVVEGGATRYTLYDGQTPLLDFNGSGTVTARYLDGPAVDQVLARETTGGVVAWYITDRLGTVRDVVNNLGTVIDHIDYSVYGNVTAESSSSNGDRFKYAEMELDAVTALAYDRARWYNSSTGRFVNQDPTKFLGNDVNTYRADSNNPVNFVDVSGLKPIWGTLPWMKRLPGSEGRLGSTIGEILGKPYWDGSHPPGKDGRHVPPHGDVCYRDADTGEVRKQRYTKNGVPFSEEQNANVQVEDDELKERDREANKRRREENQDRGRGGEGRMSGDPNPPGSVPPAGAPDSGEPATNEPDEQERRSIPAPTYQYPSWISLWGEYLNPLYTPTYSVDGLDTMLKWGKGTFAGVAIVASGGAIGLTAMGAGGAGAASTMVAGSITPEAAAGLTEAAIAAGLLGPVLGGDQ